MGLVAWCTKFMHGGGSSQPGLHPLQSGTSWGMSDYWFRPDPHGLLTVHLPAHLQLPPHQPSHPQLLPFASLITPNYPPSISLLASNCLPCRPAHSKLPPPPCWPACSQLAPLPACSPSTAPHPRLA
uniref:Uncharacterized protein n=1 Tax=Pipistrellus kuhlii TaxID=59472 RepID=A0A7J8B181_PIPKU|nr:hypothetical protein mPipKuh1_007758 [Pipistrellus kuhlii]